MSQSSSEHRAQSPPQVPCAVITVSDTRTLATDTGGNAIVSRLEQAGHPVVARQIVPDDPDKLRPLIAGLVEQNEAAAILITGGTGIASRDQTFETICGLVTRPLPGFGELFRYLSFQEIGAAAMLSRATAGLVGRVVLFSMPGSPHAVGLAMDRLILPELGHVVREARR